MRRIVSITLAVALISGCPLLAQDSVFVHENAYQDKILFLPALGSTPETGFMFGAVVVPQFKLSGSGPETRSSSLFFSGIYTTKNQVLLSLLSDIILPDEKWVFTGNYFTNYFPNSYWGIGPATGDNDEMNILFTQVHIKQTALKKVRRGLFTGPFIRWSKVFNLSFQSIDGRDIPAPNDPGAEGSVSTGVGWMIRRDLRDSNMTPTRNHFVEFSSLVNPSLFGSTNPYTSFLFDARKYIQIGRNERSVLAFQGLFRSAAGNPSFLDMSELGGAVIGRGYYGGRYRDLNAAQIQSELRKKVMGRLGVTVFGALGEVWHRYEDIKLSSVKWSAGAGIRFNVNKDDPTNIRIDYGIGRGTSGLYIQLGEAF
ncbi:BamA/TamA family outer membrane protein [Rhodohalobacter mucosus]|uniref:BamA/TamA family outer membrane protein n=1 Tax=Rhodohalobacter mucosus TaxID=2079485 RepID=UPI001304DFE7|nr:BamA/TamA family outer membrane protein [Rhodohalobacter mucosus]